MAKVEVDDKKLAAGLIVGFVDGSYVYYDAPKIGNDAGPFAAAFGD